MKEEDIQEELNFSEYGIDSILVNVINEINKRLNLTLQTTILFDYYHVKLLTGYISEEYETIIASSLETERAKIRPALQEELLKTFADGKKGKRLSETETRTYAVFFRKVR